MTLDVFPLEDVLGAEFNGEYRADLATITGQRSNQEIATLVERLVRDTLGASMRGAFFAAKSVGAVFGLELGSGERVVLKLFHPSQSLAALRVMQHIVELLERSEFPVPRCRSALLQTEDAIVGAFYEFVDGNQRDGHDPDVRHELARTLASLTRIVELEDPKELLLAPTRQGVLWPDSHRSFLKLDEVPEASWIDDVGRHAQSVVQAVHLPMIPAHLDWGVKNARFHEDRICAVYDWDSVCAASEAEMVGRAAAQFTAQWDLPAPLVPTPIEAQAFVEEYEQARGRSFSEEERRVIVASANYLVAQVARLEFASGNPQSDGFLSLLRSRDRFPLLGMDGLGSADVR